MVVFLELPRDVVVSLEMGIHGTTAVYLPTENLDLPLRINQMYTLEVQRPFKE